jgi:hypothetical protein
MTACILNLFVQVAVMAIQGPCCVAFNPRSPEPFSLTPSPEGGGGHY